MTTKKTNRCWYWLLLIPLASLWTPGYNQVNPEIGGIPFFYWYQLLWVLLSAAITGIVFFKTRRQ
ncbi:MAG: DUF3311 domain-containing protein [Proteobacteria bacterium]|nr:DUF3311 domain-containing protein [Pseudomonadota bacterium]MDE3208280.1 DUF3311 domain-containing protein [Pseudomonadota bacterium]